MVLNDKNFFIMAIRNYDMKRAISVEEILDDLKRFQYLKRLFKRYDENDELKVRLILNHITILYNCFGPIATTMLFMKLEGYHKYLKPFIVFLDYMPENIEYNNSILKNSDIPMDDKIINELRKI